MLRNIGSSWVAIALTVAATYVLTPFVIGTLGREGYGVWTLITAMTGYMSLLALGVPMACVRFLAQHVAEKDIGAVNRTIGTCAGLYLMIGAGALVVGGILAFAFGRIYDVPPAFQAQAPLAVALMALQVSAGFIGLLPEGVMFAHHDFVIRNVIRVCGVLLRLGLTIGLLSIGASLVSLALVQVCCLALDFGLSWFIIRRRYPGVRISIRDFDWVVLRRIFSFSLYVLVLIAGGRLSFETDALVIGAFRDVGDIAYYVVANSVVVCLMDFVVAIASVVSPMTTKLRTEGQTEPLRDMFLKWSKAAFSLTVLAALFLSVLGPRFIGWWIDPTFERPSGQVLQILVLSSLAFLPVRGVALPVMMGLGKPKIPTLAFLGAGLLNLALSIALIGPYGLVGVAVGTAIPNVLFSVVVLVVACRELGITLANYVKYVVPRAALAGLPVLALLVWCRDGLHVQSLPGLVAAGSSMVLLFGVMAVVFVYRGDPYVDVRHQLVLRRIWKWS
jgi:O-antigen/teichoic acid export membrane protein